MALFGKKKTEKSVKAKKTKSTAAVSTAPKALPTDYNLDGIILHPRITEKAIAKNDNNVYTFVVRRDATKHQISAAVTALYKVTPVKVNIVNKAPAMRYVGSRNKDKHVAGMKKAYVYLNKGDTINLV